MHLLFLTMTIYKLYVLWVSTMSYSNLNISQSIDRNYEEKIREAVLVILRRMECFLDFLKIN